jgi:hypothetical protein
MEVDAGSIYTIGTDMMGKSRYSSIKKAAVGIFKLVT